MREHGDVALVLEEIGKNLGRVPKLHRKFDARIGPIERSQHLGDVIGADGTDRQFAVLEFTRLLQEVTASSSSANKRVVIASSWRPASVSSRAALAENSSSPYSFSSAPTWAVSVGWLILKTSRRH